MNRIVLTCVCVFAVVVFVGGKSLACTCQNPVASMSIEPSTYDPSGEIYYVCSWDFIAFDASASNDPDWEEGDCENTLDGIRKFEWDWTNDGTYDTQDEPGDGSATHTFSTTGNYTVKLRVHDDDDDCCCSDCEDKTDTWTAQIVVVVHAEVDIAIYGDFVLWLADNSHRTYEDLPAVGTPEGGTYSWEVIESGAGSLSIVGGTTDAEVDIRAAAPSNPDNDTSLKVTYTYEGATAEDSQVVPIWTPKSTNSFEGVLWEAGSGPVRRAYRRYYHELVNQFGIYTICESGVTCTEDVVKLEGANWSKTSPGPTDYRAADGGWTGGIALEDTLGASVTHSYGEFRQTLTVGGAVMTPTYDIFIDPADYTGKRLWKE